MKKQDEMKAAEGLTDVEEKGVAENDVSEAAENEGKKPEKSNKTGKKNTVRKVSIRLPLSKTEKDDVFVAVNGKRYLIKRGVTVEVPWNVAKVLERSEKMLEVAIAYEAEAAAKANTF